MVTTDRSKNFYLSKVGCIGAPGGYRVSYSKHSLNKISCSSDT